MKKNYVESKVIKAICLGLSAAMTATPVIADMTSVVAYADDGSEEASESSEKKDSSAKEAKESANEASEAVSEASDSVDEAEQVYEKSENQEHYDESVVTNITEASEGMEAAESKISDAESKIASMDDADKSVSETLIADVADYTQTTAADMEDKAQKVTDLVSSLEEASSETEIQDVYNDIKVAQQEAQDEYAQSKAIYEAALAAYENAKNIYDTAMTILTEAGADAEAAETMLSGVKTNLEALENAKDIALDDLQVKDATLTTITDAKAKVQNNLTNKTGWTTIDKYFEQAVKADTDVIPEDATDVTVNWVKNSGDSSQNFAEFTYKIVGEDGAEQTVTKRLNYHPVDGNLTYCYKLYDESTGKWVDDTASTITDTKLTGKEAEALAAKTEEVKAEVSAEYADLSDKAEAAEAKVESAEQKVADLKDKIADLKSEGDYTNSQLSKLEEQLAQAKANLLKAEKTLDEINEEVAAVTSEETIKSVSLTDKDGNAVAGTASVKLEKYTDKDGKEVVVGYAVELGTEGLIYKYDENGKITAVANKGTLVKNEDGTYSVQLDFTEIDTEKEQFARVYLLSPEYYNPANVINSREEETSSSTKHYDSKDYYYVGGGIIKDALKEYLDNNATGSITQEGLIQKEDGSYVTIMDLITLTGLTKGSKHYSTNLASNIYYKWDEQTRQSVPAGVEVKNSDGTTTKIPFDKIYAYVVKHDGNDKDSDIHIDAVYVEDGAELSKLIKEKTPEEPEEETKTPETPEEEPKTPDKPETPEETKTPKKSSSTPEEETSSPTYVVDTPAAGVLGDIAAPEVVFTQAGVLGELAAPEAGVLGEVASPDTGDDMSAAGSLTGMAFALAALAAYLGLKKKED